MTAAAHEVPLREARLHGLVAEFRTPDALKRAARVVRDAGYTRFDCHSPFPVHGIDPAMGIRPTKLPWVVLACGLVGCGGALLMQWWMNAVDYPFLISGKPLFSLPANIPIVFELTVLLSAFGAFFGALVMNDLPRFHNPLFSLRRFRKVTDDGFFLVVHASDPMFDAERTRALLAETAPAAIEVCHEDDSPAELPSALKTAGLIVFLVSMVPLALAFKGRYALSEKPRLHVFFDMDSQPKFKAQRASAFFPDGRVMRLPVRGTIAREDAAAPGVLETGKAADGSWAAKSPIPWTVAVLRRGRKAFNIHCAVCHGVSGHGDGPVALRARELAEPKWAPPTNLHLPRIRDQKPGEIFNTITNGIRNMPAYGPQIPVEDRWAIVGYLKALQRSRRASLSDVPAGERGKLK